MAPVSEQETKEEAAQREAEHAERMAEHEREQKRREEECKAEFERSSSSTRPSTLAAPQSAKHGRTPSNAFLPMHPRCSPQRSYGYSCPHSSISTHTSTLTALPDNKLTQFALRPILTGHTTCRARMTLIISPSRGVRDEERQLCKARHKSAAKHPTGFKRTAKRQPDRERSRLVAAECPRIQLGHSVFSPS